VSRQRARAAQPRESGAVRAFLGEAIDHAPLFPPARLAMPEAFGAYERAEAGPHFWMLGRFVVGVSRLEELLAEPGLEDPPDPLPLAVVLDGRPGEDLLVLGALARAYPQRIAVETIEAAAPLDALVEALDAAGLPGEPAIYVELPVADPNALESALLELNRLRESSERDAGAKVRCGGLTAEVAPTPAQLAHFVALTQALGVPFKATAGLHHPIRHVNAEAGFAMHGFMNLIGAAVLARAHGFDRRELETLLADEDPAHFKLDAERFAWCGVGAHPGEIGAARARSCRSFGSCSFDEPVDDLIALGILERA
jgi:hypothetical protein